MNPAGNFNPEVFSTLLRGREVQLPNIGMETVHHVHADDVAQSFVRAMSRRSVAVGESIHIVSPAALTLRGYAERISAHQRVVWTSGVDAVSAVGGVKKGCFGERGGGDLGSHCAFVKLQHRHGPQFARV